MSRKVRRVRQTRREKPTQAIPVSSRKTRRGRQKKEEVDLHEAYAYVIKDLRRIFLLATVMFALLIVANLVWPFIS